MSDGWERTERGWRKVYGAEREPSRARSDLACPRIASDTMEPTEHIDGKHYTSKAKFREVTKAHGYVEVGNDAARFKQPGQKKPDAKARRAAVERAITQHT